MPLNPDEIADLGLWHFIQFSSPKMQEDGLARYQRFLERERAEALRKWVIGDAVQP